MEEPIKVTSSLNLTHILYMSPATSIAKTFFQKNASYKAQVT